MTTLEAPGKPELVIEGDVYRFSWPSGIEAELERFAEHRDELTAEITIRSSRPPRQGLLHSARLNLVSTQARRTLAQELAKRDGDLDWAGMVEQLCFIARERWRRGEPPIDMRFYERKERSRWLLEPFVERGGPTVLFADGGTGKSLLALAMAVSVATGRSVIGRPHGDPCAVLYADFETDADTLDERLGAVLAGAGVDERPPIFYKRLAASVPEAAATLRREVAEHGVGFVVIDSLGAARGGEPESADFTIRLFNAARSLGVPWLGVDHVTKAAGNDSTRPFGSTYTHNLARLSWSVDKSQEEAASSLVVALRNHKRNNGRLLPQRGYRIEFETAEDERLVSMRFRAAELTEVPELAAKLPLKQRILAELRGGPLKRPVLAEALNADPVQLRARIADLKKREFIVEREDGTIWLAERYRN